MTHKNRTHFNQNNNLPYRSATMIKVIHRQKYKVIKFGDRVRSTRLDRDKYLAIKNLKPELSNISVDNHVGNAGKELGRRITRRFNRK